MMKPIILSELRGVHLIYAIDPGPVRSALVIFDGATVYRAVTKLNDEILAVLATATLDDDLVIEQIAHMGMPVGAEVFESVFVSGRFAQAWPNPLTWHRLKRVPIKLHLCGSARAKDANVRQALVDRFGGKLAAIGTKHAPGPLYGVTGDAWSALAVACVYWDLRATATRPS